MGGGRVDDVARLLEALGSGDEAAADQLLSLVYSDLKRLAVQRMAHEAPGHTLQPTALVHEAWLRLTGGGTLRFGGREHFFGAAAEAMRRILVDSARRRQSLKRGGGVKAEELDEAFGMSAQDDARLLALDEALERLAVEDAVAARVVKLRYFVGMSMEESASALGLSVRSTERVWTFARAWLRRSLGQSGKSGIELSE